MPPSATMLVRVDALAHGGEGVGAMPSGKKVFVPLVAPGDLVEVELVREKAHFARGRLVRVVEPGASRRAPRCRHADASEPGGLCPTGSIAGGNGNPLRVPIQERCGGCQLQQVTDEAQLRAKEDAFYASLERLGALPRADIPDARAILPSPSAFGYRARCRLRVAGGALGFCGWRSSAVVPIEECPVLSPALERVVLALGAELSARPIPGARDLHVCVDDGAAGAAALFLESPAGQARERAAALLAAVPCLQGLLVVGPGGAPVVLGDPVLTAAAPRAPGVRLRLRPDLFAQANPAANELLVGLVLELLAPTPDDVVLDLYAGAGNFTFALAQRSSHAIAVEESAPSLALAGRAAEAAGLRDRVRLVAGDAVVACGRLAADRERVDLALMDPPRVGAKETPSALARLGPHRIVYVSCDPATLARDVRAFRANGYRVTAAAPVDMFPQTYHVEGVVLLER